ncbi:MAG: nitroreductase family protein [Candidatus Micrarchaeota archaeon]
MELFETIQNRFSCRAFSDTPVENEKIKKILDAINLAPSAGNKQAYKIAVVRSEITKKDLAYASHEQTFIEKAPYLLVFLADQKASSVKYAERGESLYCIQDATLAAAYAQLVATALGLATCWIGAFDPLEVSRVVRAKAFQIPIAIIPIGYPEEAPKEKIRKSLANLIYEA